MISGGYQGGFILSVIKKAAKEGLLSQQFAQAIAGVGQLTSKEIDDFLYYPYSGNNVLASCCAKNQDQSTDDCMVLYYIIDEMVERASKLVAVNLSSVMLKTGKGRNPCKPVCVTAEGTTFYKSKLFRSKLDYYMKKYLNKQKGVHCEFVKADNATLIGTAIAGLLN
jgi:hexokinase